MPDPTSERGHPGAAADAAAQPAARPRWRALAALGLFALGLVIAKHTGEGLASSAWFAAAAGCAAASTAARGGWPVRAGLAAAMLLAGAGWWTLRVTEARLQPPDAGPVAWHGVVDTVPRFDPGVPNRLLSGRGSGPSTRFGLALLAAETPTGRVALRGRVEVTVRGPGVRVALGEALRVRGVFEPRAAARNPGAWDRRDVDALDGRLGRVEVEQAALLAASDQPLGPRAALERAALAWLGGLRAFAGRGFEAAFGAGRAPGRESRGDAEARALLDALLLGRDEHALAPVSDAFGRLGVVHVLSISGFHLVVMAGAVTLLLRLTGERGGLEAALVALAVALYVLIVPAEAPVVRSGAMVFALLLSEASGRRYDRVSTLAWIALALLLWRPTDAFSPGFQLSVGVTGALLWLSPRWQAALLRPKVLGPADPLALDPANWPLRRRVRTGLAAALATSLVAWVVSTPVVMHHAGILSPLAWLTGLVLAPAFLVLLWGGFAAVLLGALVPGVGAVLGGLLEPAAQATLWLVRGLDGWSWMAWRVPELPAAWTLAATAAAALGASGFGLRRAGWWWLTAGVLAWLAALLARAPALPAGVELRVDALSVGPGTAVLARSHTDAVAWGMGSRWRGTVRQSVPAAARALGVWRVPVVVIPGTREEDFAGLSDVAAYLETREVLLPRGFAALAADRPDGPHADLLRRLAARGIRSRTVAAGDELRFGSARLTFHETDAAGSGLVGVLDDTLLLAAALPPESVPAALDAHPGASVVMLPAGAKAAAMVPWLLAAPGRAAWRSAAPPGWVDAAEQTSPRPPGFLDTGVDGALRFELLDDGTRRVDRSEPAR